MVNTMCELMKMRKQAVWEAGVFMGWHPQASPAGRSKSPVFRFGQRLNLWQRTWRRPGTIRESATLVEMASETRECRLGPVGDLEDHSPIHSIQESLPTGSPGVLVYLDLKERGSALSLLWEVKWGENKRGVRNKGTIRFKEASVSKWCWSPAQTQSSGDKIKMWKTDKRKLKRKIF